MKKYTRIFSAALAACLLLSLLSACGGGGARSTADPAAAAGGKVWTGSFTELPDLSGNVNAVCTADGRFYAAVRSTASDGGTASADGAGVTGSTGESAAAEPVSDRLMSLSADGSDCAALPDYAPMTPPEGSQGSCSINALCAAPDGGLWVAESCAAYHYDLPEGFAGTDEEKAQYFSDDGSVSRVRLLTDTGAEKTVLDLSGLTSGESGAQPYVNALVCDGDGNLYVFDGNNNALYVFGPDGALLGPVSAGESWISYLIRLSDGRAAVGAYGQSDFEVRPVDPKARTLGDAVSLGIPSALFSGEGDCSFFCTSGTSLYGCDAASGETRELVNLLDCNVMPTDVRALIRTGDETMACLTCSSEDNTAELASLSRQDASAAGKKTVLTLATLYADNVLNKQVLTFNRASSDVRISVRCYAEGGDYSQEATNAAITKLNTEIISGSAPDIISLDQLPVRQYAAKGLLEDLYPFLDADGELTRDSLLPGIRKAMEVDGHLYQASPGFAVYTIVGPSDKVGTEMGWTLDEMLALLKDAPEGTELFQQGLTKTDLLTFLCAMNMDRYVNWDTGKCSFDSEDFRKLLEFCGTFPDSYDYSSDSYEDEASRVRAGKQLLSLFASYDFQEFQLYEAMYGGSITYKGFPAEDRDGNVAYISTSLAISSTCAHKDAAWSFVRTFLTEAYQESGDVWSFPTNRKAFESRLADAMKKTYTTNEKGEQVEASKGGFGMEGLSVEIYALTQAQADQITALINSVDRSFSMDTAITDIIKDEAAAYFSGSRSAEDAAKNVQSRVNLYVNEQR